MGPSFSFLQKRKFQLVMKLLIARNWKYLANAPSLSILDAKLMGLA